MSKPFVVPAPLKTAAVAALLLCSVSQAFAQSAMERAEERRARHANKGQEKAESAESVKVEAQYPNATRKEPETKASAKLTPKLQKMFDAYDKDDTAAVVATADEILADEKANPYERAVSARLAGAALLNDDQAKAKNYMKQALQFEGLNNNDHFESMFLLAQLQLQDDEYAESLATIDKFLVETKSAKPEHLAVKGNALYRLERYPEAATVLKQAVEASPEPKADLLQLLMGTYVEMNQPGEAAKIAEGLTAKNPDDKRAQMNLASIYMQTDQNDKAAALLEKLRSSGQLNEDRDYRNLYALYLGSEGKEKEAVSVINEGLQKNILKPDYQTYVALAQAYYFSTQPTQAIEAYRKAAPLAPDGETYLNLAKTLWQEGQIGEAKQAAQQAIDKGIKKPDDAKKILALPGK
jgi:tetratricopeptide (TPR) repeat protein